MKSDKSKIIKDCEWAINKILSQGYTTVTSMQFFKDVIAHLKHPSEIVYCKNCKHRDPEDHKCDCGHDIQWQLPRADDWYCADGERRTKDA